jgi:hypothetical protein
LISFQRLGYLGQEPVPHFVLRLAIEAQADDDYVPFGDDETLMKSRSIGSPAIFVSASPNVFIAESQ